MLFLNGDDEYFHILKKYSECQIAECGGKKEYKYNFSNISADENACYGFDFNFFSKKITDIKLSIPGFHNVYNAVLAAAISFELGVDQKIIKESIEETSAADCRMEIIREKDVYKRQEIVEFALKKVN